jgi:putative PIN family toxin of toxin-antitoxin system
MKVFFDTNVYVAEALVGGAAEAMLSATANAAWRIFVSSYVLDEVERVLTEDLVFPRRLARLTRQRCRRRAVHVEEHPSRHAVPDDPADSPVLQAALQAGVDYLVTNDKQLLKLDPYEGVRIVSMTAYYQLLIAEGLLP